MKIPTASHPALVTAILVVLFSTVPAWSDPGQNTAEGAIQVTINDERVSTVRLEIFDGSSTRLFDSGPITGRVVQLSEADLAAIAEPMRAGEGPTFESLNYEIRAWDAGGKLVLSQLAALPEGAGTISSIDFQTIPPNTVFGAATITLAGDVLAQQDLTVNQSLRTSQLRNLGGGNFVGSCASGSSIRTISATGGVVCEIDDTGGSDNLGNHTATQDLDMSSHAILFDNDVDMLRTDGNAQLKTGDIGHTLMIKGGDAVSDIAQFRDVMDVIKLRVNGSGRLMFLAGQKVCSVFKGEWRTSLLVSDGWTAATCDSYQNTISSSGEYQLFCLFDNGYSFGSIAGGIPSPNCGW